MRGNRYAAGALALSAGLSIYTASSLPRGSVADSWLSAPSPRAQASRRPAKKALRPSRTARALATVAAAFASWTSAPARPAAKPAPPARRHPARFFAERPQAPAVRPVRTEPMDGLSLVRAGRGPDRVVGYAGAESYQPASTGRLEGFRWQQPAVRPDE